MSERLLLYTDETNRMSAFLGHLADDRGYLVERYDDWATTATAPPPLGTLLYEYVTRQQTEAVIDFGTSLAKVTIAEPANAHVRALAATRADADAAIAALREAMPEKPLRTVGRVRVRFWYLGPHGPTSTSRLLAVPDWPSIRGNYAAATRAELERLTTFRPTHGGQIILWHGDPGTGKTYALRSLIKGWSDWADAEYVVDPENLFTASPAYLMGLLDERSPTKWKLLVLEDAGEYVRMTAKEDTGQGLSRFLNVTDGLIGQGMKIVVLITTNEPGTRIHPAVRRPGRSAAIVEFTHFGWEDAVRWFGDLGLAPPTKRSAFTLAEMYAAATGSDPRLGAEAVGFRVPDVADVAEDGLHIPHGRTMSWRDLRRRFGMVDDEADDDGESEGELIEDTDTEREVMHLARSREAAVAEASAEASGEGTDDGNDEPGTGAAYGY